MIMTKLKTVKPKEDMTGWKMWEHGVPESRLKVIEQSNDGIIGGVYFATWLCECTCGTKKVLLGKYIRSGKTKSCGCLFVENAKRTDRRNNTK
jgi:hypothetical protein